MDYRLGFQSEYLSALDLGTAEPTVCMERFTLAKVADPETGSQRQRLIAWFQGKTKGMIVNKTNALCLIAMFKSKDTDGWVGKSITLHVQEVKHKGEMMQAIRIKGSPDIAAPVSVEIKLPMKRPQTITLVPTKKAGTGDAD